MLAALSSSESGTNPCHDKRIVIYLKEYVNTCKLNYKPCMSYIMLNVMLYFYQNRIEWNSKVRQAKQVAIIILCVGISNITIMQIIGSNFYRKTVFLYML